MFSFFKHIFSVLFLVVLIFVYFKVPIPQLENFSKSLSAIKADIPSQFSYFEKIAVLPILHKIEMQIFAPAPLRIADQSSVSETGTTEEHSHQDLTRLGVIAWTNYVRKNEAGLKPLLENKTLNASAEMKLRDLFEKQYFEHVSPTGKGPADLAKAVGYSYIVIGENLALGNFKDDASLVEAWMNSPGHRANILNTRYSEIGVAVGRGVYEGNETWIAVQSFGLPFSACPLPSDSLLRNLEAGEAGILTIQRELQTRKAEMDAMKKNDPLYNQKVNEYNVLVGEYNDLVDVTKALTAQYNKQVELANTCRTGN